MVDILIRLIALKLKHRLFGLDSSEAHRQKRIEEDKGRLVILLLGMVYKILWEDRVTR